MIRHHCPPHHRWAALLADDLPPAEQADLNGHLELCPACQRALESCAAQPDAWAAARSLGALTQPRSPVLSDVIDQLKIDPDSDHDSSHGAELPLDYLDPSDRPGPIGRIHQYEVLEEVGRGGMGVVLKALDPGLHRVCAIKVLAPQLAVSGTARKRFTREARAAAAVGHENVVTIHAVEEFKGLPYLVMQYIAGPSVQQRIADSGPLPVAEILRIGFQTAAGLAAAHAQGLIHRDVKPANILLENGVERVKLTDFSLARAIDDASVTQTGVVTGTPPFMAPEQARGEPLDHRADLFSLGSVLYAMCTGRPPFRGQSLDVLRKVSEETPVSIRTLNPEIPTWLEAIVRKLMAKKPEDRYQSAGEVSALLERCLAHVQQPTAVPLPAVPDMRKSRARSKRFLSSKARLLRARLFIGLAAAAAAVLLAATVLRIRTDNGTLEITVDDPQAKVMVDGTDIVVSGIQGVQEFRLKTGDYKVHQTKDGKPEKMEVVSIKQGEKTPLRVTFEADRMARVAGNERAPIRDIQVHAQDRDRAAVRVAKAQADLRVAQAQVVVAEANLAVTKPSDGQARRRLAEAEVAAAKAKLDAAERLAAQAVETTAEQAMKRQPDRDEERLWDAAQAREQAAAESATGIGRALEQIGLERERQSDGYERMKNAEAATRLGATLTQSQRSFPTDSGETSSIVFSPEGSRLYVADWSGTMQAYDFTAGRKLWTTASGKSGGENRFLAMSPDGKLLASSGADKAARLWDPKTGKLVRLLKENAGMSYSVAFSPDGDTVAVGVANNKGSEVKLWDVRSGGSNYDYKFDSSVMSVAYGWEPRSPQFVAAGTGGGTVYVIGYRSMADMIQFSQRGAIRALAFSPGDTTLAAAGGPEIKLWDWQNRRERATLVGHAGRVNTVQFSPDGKWLVSSSLDGTAKLWDAVTGQCVATVATAKYQIGMGAAAFTPDGKSLVTAGDDGMIRVWDLTPFAERTKGADGRPLGVPVLSGVPLLGGMFTKRVENARVTAEAAALQARIAKLEDMVTQSKAELAKLRETFGPNHPQIKEVERIITELEGMIERSKPVGANDGVRFTEPQLRVTKLENKLIKAKLDLRGLLTMFGPNHPSVKEAQQDIAATENLIAHLKAAGVNDGARITEPQRRFQAGAGVILSAAFLDAGRKLLVAGNRPLQIIDVQNGEISGATAGPWGSGPIVAASDGETFAVASERLVQVWNWKTGKQLDIGPAHFAAILAVAFGPGSNTLAVGGRTDIGGGLVKLWDLKDRTVRQIEFPTAILSLAFDMAGQDRLAVGLNADNVRMVDTKKAEVIYTLPQPGPIDQVAFSKDAKWLATTEGENHVILWDWQTSRKAATLAGHSERVTSVRFSPDGSRLLTASLDGMVRLWDVASTKIIASITPNAGKLYVAEFSPDGHWIITAGTDREIRFWDITSLMTGAANMPGHSHETTPSANDKEPPMKSIVSAFIGLGLSVAAPTATAGENILQNPSFEEGKQSPAHWSQGADIDGVQYLWDKEHGKEGKASVCLHKTAKRYFPIAQWYQVVDRAGDKPLLRVTGQVKAEDVTKAIIDVVFLNEQGEWISHQWASYIGAKQPNDPAVSHDWKEYAGTVKIPPKTKKIQIGLQIYGPGKVWFDAVRAEYATE